MIRTHFKPMHKFRTVNAIGVHQVLTEQRDIDEAFYNAERDGFADIYWYVPVGVSPDIISAAIDAGCRYNDQY